MAKSEALEQLATASATVEVAISEEDSGLRAIVKAAIRQHSHLASVVFLLMNVLQKGMRRCDRNDSDNAEEVYLLRRVELCQREEECEVVYIYKRGLPYSCRRTALLCSREQ